MNNIKTQTDWDNFYMSICSLIAQQSYAEDRKVGAIIVKDDNIIAFSYNGTARGTNNDTQSNPVLHAEAHAIAKVARSNLSTSGATLYCTLSPCMDCSKLILAAGISRVVYQSEFKCTEGIRYLSGYGIVINRTDIHNTLFTTDQLRNTGLL
jgi:dCMP deaminase